MSRVFNLSLNEDICKEIDAFVESEGGDYSHLKFIREAVVFYTKWYYEVDEMLNVYENEYLG
jgi:hypothetical protein